MKKRRLLIACLALSTSCYAQDAKQTIADPEAVVTNSFWDNWYGQVGVDMHLQFPKGHNLMDVFPNGQSFGVDVVVYGLLRNQYHKVLNEFKKSHIC